LLPVLEEEEAKTAATLINNKLHIIWLSLLW
jgi:hypothetical protein